LEELPLAERQDWRALWGDLDAQLERAELPQTSPPSSSASSMKRWITVDNRHVEEAVRAFQVGSEPPVVKHHIAGAFKEPLRLASSPRPSVLRGASGKRDYE
jgi:hypothetical protein